MASSCPGLPHPLPPPQIWRAGEGSQSRLQPQLFLFPSLPPSHSLAISAAKIQPASWCPLSWEMLLLGVGPGASPEEDTGGGPLGMLRASRLRRGTGWQTGSVGGCPSWRTVWEKKEPPACGGGCLHVRMTGIREPGHPGIWLIFETNPYPIPSLGPRVPVMTSKETPLDRGPEDGGPLL